jgi:hypothetical protein
MTSQIIRILAKRILAFHLVSNLVIRMYPLASAFKFESISQSRLVHIIRLISTPRPNQFQLMRIGSHNDGGYLAINDFSKDDTLVSLGIGDNIDFERDISSHVGKILAFDHTVDLSSSEITNLTFCKVGVKAKSTPGFTTLAKIVEENSLTGDLILKIDIEGWEWEVLDSLNSLELSRFKQIIGEFHGFHEIRNFDLIERVVNKLSEYFVVTNSHANNWGAYQIIQRVAVPDVVEISWLRKDRSNLIPTNAPNRFENLNTPNNPSSLDLGYNFFQ